MSEPADEGVPRWIDAGSGVSDELRSIVASAVMDEPSGEAIAALRGRLGDILGPHGPSGSGGAVGGTGGRLLLGAAIVGVLGAVGVWRLASGEQKPRPQGSEVQSPTQDPTQNPTQNLIQIPNQNPIQIPTQIPNPAPIANRAPSPIHSHPRTDPLPRAEPDLPASASTPGSAPVVASAAAADPEAALLARASKMLTRVPGESLRLTDEHVRRFPHGRLSYEREVIAIEALARLGHRRQASGRLARLRVEYPSQRGHIAPLTGLVEQ